MTSCRPLSPTRVSFLFYTRITPTLWRVVDRSDGAGPIRCVGPLYRTKAELLADFDRYARDAWGR